MQLQLPHAMQGLIGISVEFQFNVYKHASAAWLLSLTQYSFTAERKLMFGQMS